MDDPFAQGTAYGLKEKLEAGGVKTVVDEVYPPNTTDFGSIAAKIAASKADMVVGGSQYQDGVNLIVALQQLDYQPKLAAFSTAPTEPGVRRRRSATRPRASSRPPATRRTRRTRATRSSSRSTRRSSARRPEEDEANAYTTGQVVAAAVEAVGCAEQGECQQKLVDWVRANKVETVVGPLKWDETGKPQGAHMIQQWIERRDPDRAAGRGQGGRLRLPEAGLVRLAMPSGALLFQSVILGLLLGGLYALLAAGLTLYFGIMRVVMIAHSAFLILAAYLAWWSHIAAGRRPAAVHGRHRAAVLRRGRAAAAAAARPAAAGRR